MACIESDESEMRSLEFVVNTIRPAIAEIKPQCEHVPPKMDPLNVNLESLDKFLTRLKEKMSLITDINKHNEFIATKAAIEEDVCEIQARLELAVSRIKELDSDESPIVTVPEPGVARIEIKINSQTAWFEISCDEENNSFKGIRSEPPVENFLDLVSEQPILNELIATMTRRFKKTLGMH
ncbi:uncharacterized protein LOC111261459 isoform X1 [Varroa jacobsoni]|uniref:Kinetochore protein SPC25 n=1 Tax=Varroa destructor TaxID=109461 RepID=A0A7M7JCS2_VARDE|nr:uncharacterized protein LOC111245712 isoform X1 [Varroa destructor]XP_022690727.1 uncharacterized protein LOC111261459 isoform X1 [Varroa jacobsoni]